MGLVRNPLGPLETATLYQEKDVIFWGQTRPQEIEALDTDISYTVKIADRLDLIAFRLLGSSQFGWIILQRNGLRLAPNDLVPGQKIFIPTLESLKRRGIIV
jgi:hypothetical protein